MPQFVSYGEYDSLPVVGTSTTAEGAMFVQVKLPSGYFQWLKPSEWKAVNPMARTFDYGPLTASDDDEFFDAPAGSVLLKDGEPYAGKVGDGWDWRTVEETVVQAGALWASLDPGACVLRVPYAWAESYLGLAANRDEAEAAAKARVAAMFGGVK